MNGPHFDKKDVENALKRVVDHVGRKAFCITDFTSDFYSVCGTQVRCTDGAQKEKGRRPGRGRGQSQDLNL